MGHGIKKTTLNKIWKQKRFCIRKKIEPSKIEGLLKDIFQQKKDTDLSLSKGYENHEFKEEVILPDLILQEKKDAWIYRYKKQLRKHNNYTNYN